MIDGVVVRPLERFADERGRVLRMLRADSDLFDRFGEVYFSTVRSGAVKAWRRHRRSSMNLAVPVGRVRVVLYDDRSGSTSRGLVQEVVLGEETYALLHVPPGVWNGFQGLGPGESFLANCSSLVHDPAESDRLAPDDPIVPYAWPR